jgi:hypothetical protein
MTISLVMISITIDVSRSARRSTCDGIKEAYGVAPIGMLHTRASCARGFFSDRVHRILLRKDGWSRQNCVFISLKVERGYIENAPNCLDRACIRANEKLFLIKVIKLRPRIFPVFVPKRMHCRAWPATITRARSF